MQGGEDDRLDDDTPVDVAAIPSSHAGAETSSGPPAPSDDSPRSDTGPGPGEATDEATSIFDAPPIDPDAVAAGPPPPPSGPTLPSVETRIPVATIDPVAQRRPGASTWYRSDEERAKSVYRRANPWYRRLARAVIGLAFAAIAVLGVYAAALAVQDYLERDRLPAAGAEVPEVRATSFIVASAPPAPLLDGTLTLDASTLAFEFVGRATGPQSGLQVVSPDGNAVFVRQGTAPWRAATDTDTDATAAAVRTAVRYLADDDTADDILTNRLRRGFVDLVSQVEEGSGASLLTRYEMTFDTAGFARDFPLQWRAYQDDAVPGSTADSSVPVTIWLDTDGVLMRVTAARSNWAWERLTYSDQPFRPVDPTSDADSRIVQVACVSDDNSIFWQTPLASCDTALAAARDAAIAAGLGTSFDDLDRAIARVCSTMEREDGPLPATTVEAALAEVLVDTGVCRGDPTIFTPG